MHPTTLFKIFLKALTVDSNCCGHVYRMWYFGLCCRMVVSVICRTLFIQSDCRTLLLYDSVWFTTLCVLVLYWWSLYRPTWNCWSIYYTDVVHITLHCMLACIMWYFGLRCCVIVSVVCRTLFIQSDSLLLVCWYQIAGIRLVVIYLLKIVEA